jgi:hypothetical protein
MTTRHPSKAIQAAIGYAQTHGWIVAKSSGGHAHAWGAIRCTGDCPQVSIYSTPRVPENHARAIRRAVDRCDCHVEAHEKEGE